VKLSINILTWNTLPTLNATLEILKQELMGKKAEIIIVDNGSIDGCQDLATIKNPTNLGISKGKNQGVDASKGEYIFLIDGDVIPVPNSINMLENYLDTHPECKAIGFFPDKFTNRKNTFRNEHHESYCSKLDPVRIHHGHCIYYGIYRREVFEKIRFDESYGPGYGYEDLDSWMQMQAKGIDQWAAGMNTLIGKYYHAINSSVNNPNCLGHVEYMKSSMARSQIFKKKWQKATVHA